MSNVLINLSLLCWVSIASASELNIKIGDPLENLLASEGDASVVEEFIDRGAPFVRFFYQNVNRSFIVNKETNYICDIAIGITGGNCFPCEQAQTSAMCP